MDHLRCLLFCFIVAFTATNSVHSIYCEALTVFRLSDRIPGNPRRGVDFTDMKKKEVVSAEIISTEQVRGLELCINYKTIFAVSDVPSCNVHQLSTCDWETDGHATIVGIGINNYSEVSSTAGRYFRTKSSSLRLEKICMRVKYWTESSDALLNLHAESVDGRERLTAIPLSKGILDSILILTDVPSQLRGKNISLIIDVESSSIVYVERILGCNPYRQEDRYIMKWDNSRISAATVSSLRAGPPGEGCKYGGRLIKATGKCTCPAGFTGDDCGTGCGFNRLGPDCQVECSAKNSGCRNMIICKHLTGCYCAPGWKGDNCEYKCSDSEYGAGCKEDCGHCKGGGPCDIFTGHCRQGCAPGFSPPMCQSKFIYLNKPPLVLETNYTSAKLRVNITSENLNGVGLPKYYKIQCKDATTLGNTRWIESAARKMPNGTVIEDTVRNLTHGRTYDTRIILLDEQLNSYEGEDLPSTKIYSKCSENDLVIEADDIGEDYLVITWKHVSKGEYGCNYGNFTVSILYDDWSHYAPITTSITFENLLPNRTYYFKVKENGKYSSYHFASFTTLPRVTGEVEGLKVTDVDRNSVQLIWTGQPTKEQLYNITYECLRVLLEPSVDCTGESGAYNSTSEQITIGGLRPFTRYSIRVRQLPGAQDTETSTTTALFVENPGLNLESSSTETSIDVSWKMDCPMCYVFSGGFFIKLEFQESVDRVEAEGRPLKFVKDESYSFNNLRPGTTYKLSLYVSDESRSIISEPFSAVVRTKSRVPSAVRDLSVYKVGRRSVGLRWRSPTDSQGRIERFSVGREGRPEHHKPAPCPAWPQQFCYTLRGLTPDTVYNLSVSAQNELVAEDGDKSYITVKTTESAPEAPTDPRTLNVSDTSVTLSWGPPYMFYGTIRSFLVKIEHTESRHPSHCCQYVPKVEVPFDEERPLYKTQVTGLMSASRYAVSVMAETAWVGQAATWSFSTRPSPPSSVLLPNSVTLQLSNSSQPVHIVWPEHNAQQQAVANLTDIRNLLVLVPEGADDSSNRTSTADDGDLVGLMQNTFGGHSFDILTQYNEGDDITLVSDSGADSLRRLESGQSYKLAAVTVDQYCGLHTIRADSSQSFVAP